MIIVFIDIEEKTSSKRNRLHYGQNFLLLTGIFLKILAKTKPVILCLSRHVPKFLWMTFLKWHVVVILAIQRAILKNCSIGPSLPKAFLDLHPDPFSPLRVFLMARNGFHSISQVFETGCYSCSKRYFRGIHSTR